MNRIIKFRGKDELGNWHFGSYDQDNQEILYTHVDADGCHRVNVPIVPSTVGQFTGLTDFNNKDVFEGDILESPNGNKILIYWSNINFMFAVDGNCFLHSLYHLADSNIPYEIIGNIFDNPELGGNIK